jgi:outer membrane protein insertion porin family
MGWATACVAALLVGAAAAVAEPTGSVPVFVAIQSAGSGLPPGKVDAGSWLDPFTVALTGSSGPIQVVRQAVLQDSVLAEAAVSAEDWVRQRAREVGAEYGVLAKVTQLAGRASIEVRLLPAGSGPAVGDLSAQVADPAALVQGIEEIGGRARASLILAIQQSPAAMSAVAAKNTAEPVAPSGAPRITAIRVTGNRRIDADAVRAVVGSRVGGTATRDRIAQDVRRIHELGFFNDVRVLADPGPDGLVLTYQVQEHPIVRQVAIIGNDNIDSKDITEKLTLTAGSTIDYPLIIENKARIEGFYKSKGYYTASVSYKVEPVGDNTVAVNYDVTEGKRLRLREIKFVGNKTLDAKTLTSGFQTKTWGLLSFATHFFDNSGVYAEPIFYQDLDKAMRKYMDQGFIRVRMSDPKVDYDDSGLRVTVDVDEGAQFHVGKIQVAGDDSMDRNELLQRVQLKPGAVFNRSMLTDDVERLRQYYADMGFFAAEVRPRTNVDPENLTVDCVFEAGKGDLYFIDKIEVAGNMNTRDDVIRRELSVAEGELYSAAALNRSKARVRRLAFFEEVNVEAKRAEGRKVDVAIDVVERPTGSFSFGAGASGTDGFILNGSVRQDNLFGRGLSLNAVADLGSINQRASISFTNPFFMGTPTALSTGVGYRKTQFRDQNNFDQRSWQFNLGGSYPLDEGETRLGTNYNFANRKIDSFNNIANVLLQRETFMGSTTTSSQGVFWSRDTRDDPMFTRAGQLTSLNAEFAGLGGMSNFLRLEAGTTRYLPLKKWIGLNSTFVFNTRAGYVMPFNTLGDFNLPKALDVSKFPAGSVASLSELDKDLEVPLSERYFAGGLGGPFELRGFEVSSVGPRRTKLVAMPDMGNGRTVFRALGRNPFSNAPGKRCIMETGNITQNTDPNSLKFLSDDACNGVNDTENFKNFGATEVIGGNKAFVANLELQVPISEDYGVTGIAFFDTGNTFAEDESYFSALRYAAGVGGRWMSPFGPIVVYLGFPLNPVGTEKRSVFEFNFGGSSF